MSRISVALFVIAAIAFTANSLGAVKTKVIEYKAGDTLMEGFLAWDDSVAEGKKPGVLVFPEWWGLTDYPKKRAEQLAQLGYVAFAADMFGKGKTTDDPNEAGKLAGSVKMHPDVEKERLEAALDVLKSQSQADPNRLAAIGYCFGGTMALDMVRMGLPVKGVASFHGDLSTKQPAQNAKGMKILVLTGADDEWVPAEQVTQFEEEMKKAGADVKVISYPGAQHAFTNPDADRHDLKNVKYNADADKKSWEEMKKHFAELFATK
jgi:dienelactone hydrolase